MCFLCKELSFDGCDHCTCVKIFSGVNFWATICNKTVRPLLSDCCPVCDRETLVHCGQTVERIKVKLGVRVCLSPDHIVLDGDPSPPPQRGTALLPIFGPYLLRPNGCMDFQRVIFPYCLRLASHGSGTLVVLYVLRMLV